MLWIVIIHDGLRTSTPEIFFNYSCLKMHASKSNNCEMGWHTMITQVLNGRPAHTQKIYPPCTRVWSGWVVGRPCQVLGARPIRRKEPNPVHKETALYTQNLHQTDIRLVLPSARTGRVLCLRDLHPKPDRCALQLTRPGHMCTGGGSFLCEESGHWTPVGKSYIGTS